MSTEKTVLERYRKLNYHKFLFGIITLILLIILALYAIATGAVNISLKEIITALGGNKISNTYNIIWNIRLPRVLSAVAAGGGLAIAGAAMQSILRNPLGSPFTLGISQAAAFGAAFAIVVLKAGSIQSSAAGAVILNNPYATTVSAFLCALISALVIVILSKYRQATPETMILTGVALGSLFTAGTTFIQYFASDVEVSAVVFWTFGDIGRTDWHNLGIMAAAVIPAILYFMYNSWNYNALDSGEETARSLGVDAEKVRIKGMLLSSFITALIVSFVGIIGFVGLVVPHIVRKVIGGDERYLIPFSALCGGLLLLLADTAARTVIAPIVLPVGILTSFLGAPLFIYLVMRGKEYW